MPSPGPRLLLDRLRAHRGWARRALACAAVGVPLQIAHPLVWAFVVDRVLVERRVEWLVPAALVMLACQLAGNLLAGLRADAAHRAAERVRADLQADLHAKLLRQSLAYHRDHPQGDLLQRMTGDANLLAGFLAQTLNTTLPLTLSLLWAGAALAWFHWLLAAAALLPLGLVVAVTRWHSRAQRDRQRELAAHRGGLATRLAEDLQAVDLTRAFGQQTARGAALRADLNALTAAADRTHRAGAAFHEGTGALGFLVNVVVVILGGGLVLQGELTLGGLVACRGYWWTLFQPVLALAGVHEAYQAAASAGERLAEVLEAPGELPVVAGAPWPVPPEGRVELRGVSFAYPPEGAADPRPPGAGAGPDARPGAAVLDGLDLTLEPGQRVALVGDSGAGKTTILNLLLRFQDPSSGAVLLDGHDLRAVDPGWIRQHVAVVAQEPLLLDGTVLDNVRFGRPDADEGAVWEALEQAGAADFVAALPQGLATRVGPRGARLSGGQRQRLCVARAFLVQPRVLLLDEATASVEPESEARIQDALERLMRGRTTLMTTHRLAALRGVDRVVVLEGGRVVEDGRPDELEAGGGWFARSLAMRGAGLAGGLAAGA